MTVERLEAEMSNAEYTRWYAYLMVEHQEQELAALKANAKARRR